MKEEKKRGPDGVVLGGAIGLFVVMLVTYLLTLSRHYSMDSMSFALLTTRDGTGNPLFFQAEHLLGGLIPVDDSLVGVDHEHPVGRSD